MDSGMVLSAIGVQRLPVAGCLWTMRAKRESMLPQAMISEKKFSGKSKKIQENE